MRNVPTRVIEINVTLEKRVKRKNERKHKVLCFYIYQHNYLNVRIHGWLHFLNIQLQHMQFFLFGTRKNGILTHCASV